MRTAMEDLVSAMQDLSYNFDQLVGSVEGNREDAQRTARDTRAELKADIDNLGNAMLMMNDADTGGGQKDGLVASTMAMPCQCSTFRRAFTTLTIMR